LDSVSGIRFSSPVNIFVLLYKDSTNFQAAHRTFPLLVDSTGIG
jgi:hypothetical protein